nr:reverse transcriptase domain-containing protein [Tanacetum cinerariifolium]
MNGNPSRVNIKQLCGSVYGVTTSLQLSRNSRPSMLDHQDKYMMKAQVHVLKSSTISDEQPIPRRKYHCQHDKSIKWPSLGVKLCDGAVSRDANFISEIAMRRDAKTIDLMSLLPQLHDPHSELLLLRSALVEAPQLPIQAPPSPDYMPGPEHTPSPDYLYGLECLEYSVPSDDEAPIEDQPLPANASLLIE